jgi:hypothetical protein
MLKKVNTYLFLCLVALAIGMIGFSLYSLLVPSDAPDAAQSKLLFWWSMWHTLILFALVVLSLFLYKFWDRFFLFNVPLAIVLLGFYFFFPFVTFMGGWISFVGFYGLIFALTTAILLTITNCVYTFIQDAGQLNIWLTIGKIMFSSILLLLLYINSLLTKDFSTKAYFAVCLGILMIILGVEELQKKSKVFFILSLITAFFLFAVAIQM